MITCKTQVIKDRYKKTRYSSDWEWGGKQEETIIEDKLKGDVMDSKNRWWKVDGWTVTERQGNYPVYLEYVKISLNNISYTIKPVYVSGSIMGHYRSTFELFKSKYNILDDILKEGVNEYRAKEMPRELYELWLNGGNYGKKDQELTRRREEKYINTDVVSFKDGKITGGSKFSDAMKDVINPEIIKFFKEGTLEFLYTYFNTTNKKFYYKFKNRYEKVNTPVYYINVSNNWVPVLTLKVDATLDDAKKKILSMYEKAFQYKEFPNSVSFEIGKYKFDNLTNRFNYKVASNDKLRWVYAYALLHRNEFEPLIQKMKPELERRGIPDID